jgi:hypothetical protein
MIWEVVSSPLSAGDAVHVDRPLYNGVPVLLAE